MHPTDPGDCLLTELDHARLRKLKADRLTSLLAEVEVVPSIQVPADVVTMNSRVLVRDSASQALQELTLCYPDDSDVHQGFTSVLSPMGAALIGRRVGDEVPLGLPRGQSRTLRVEALLYQPEAHGDFGL